MSMDPGTRSRLVGLFVDEAQEAVEVLRRCADSLRGGDTGEPLDEFGRVAHGLKGAAAALGYEGLASALHELESVVLCLRGDSGPPASARLTTVGEALDLLSEGVARMSAASMDEVPADVLERLLAALAIAGPGPDGREPRPGAALASAEGERGPTPAEEPPSKPAAEVVDRLSVPAAEVDEALRLAASVARGAAQLHEWLAPSQGLVAASAQGLSAAAAGLEGLIAALRLIPAELALAGLDGEVAELAARLDKEVALSVSGRDVRADRRTLQTARGLIRHLVRNAIDHGIETPPARAAAGKHRAGRLSVSVEAVESVLRVEVADDGAGFDMGAIRAELLRRGDAGRVESLSDEQVLAHWALEGGSTRVNPTEVSGRGLGLSAVAQLARAAGGGIQVRSVRGLGSGVAFTLPLEVYAVEAITLKVKDRVFGIPVNAVERTIFLPASGEAVHDGPTGRTLAVGETILPLVPLAEALGQERETGRERFALVVRAEGLMAALSTDEVVAVAGLVPSAVSGVAQPDALVSGLARLADGTPIAVLNQRLLLHRVRAVRAREGRSADAGPAKRRALDVVLAEDSLATREVLRVLLEEQGFRVRLAGNGEEAMQRIAEALPDVLVSDVNMPRRDGLWLTRSLRAQHDTERLPIVLLTSQDDLAARAAGVAAGADAYLLKSQFNAGVLAETLAQLGVRAS
ncbi:MAG TPA: response regulator [Anaeromyxobacter sp.]|nr:response regulator [Anaeromyxobacter sp.]